MIKMMIIIVIIIMIVFVIIFILSIIDIVVFVILLLFIMQSTAPFVLCCAGWIRARHGIHCWPVAAVHE